MPKVKKDLVVPQAKPHRSAWPYLHVIIDPDVVGEVKREAAVRGYRIGEFTETLLKYALSKLSATRED